MIVTLTYSNNMLFTASVRNFSNIKVDEPKEFHGTNSGPSSVEYFLIGIGGCIGTTFAYCLQKNDIEIKELGIIIDGKMKHAGPNKRLRIIGVNIEILFTPTKDQSQKKIDYCLSNFREHCIVSNSITQGFPVQVKILNVKKEKKM